MLDWLTVAMKGLFFFLLLMAGVVYLFRWLRQREVDAFLDADMSDFQTFKLNQKQDEKPDPVMAKAEAFAALNPGVVTLKPSTEEGGDELFNVSAPDPSLHHLKKQAFDEVTRNMLAVLGTLIPPGHLLLTNVPLSDFVRSDDDIEFKLVAQKIPYLVVRAGSLEVVCGLQFKDGKSGGVDFVKGVFYDIGIPLLEFPLDGDLSAAEVGEVLTPVIASQDQKDCPRCGESMAVRTALKGKNTGSVFWVCKQFPGCRGVVRI